ncbi:MAG TPA: glycosyltransferase [Stellaceae bacterium]|nr:glycosyltransferase [Stellaceae bacterium]
MKVLIAEYDVFESVGGGQTVYQNIIKRRPEDDFYYFVDHEPLDYPRSPNSHPIQFDRVYRPHLAQLPLDSRHFYDIYVEAQNLAHAVQRSLGSTRFDVVDTPDYRTLGLFIRSALAEHGVTVDHVALALHGTLSSAFANNWPSGIDERRLLAELRMREHLQYRCVDIRYAISKFYGRSWNVYSDLPINYLDPLTILPIANPTLGNRQGNAPPNLAFVGRRERRKGPDLFVDFAWWLPRASYDRALIIGGDSVNRLGQGSTEILQRAARMRGISVEIRGALNQIGLQRLFQERTLVVLPSRYDQFNLVALEALLNGCPVVLSESAGAADFLRERLTGIEAPIIDLDCGRTAAQAIHEILANYDDYRARLVDTVGAASFKPDFETLQTIYEPKAEAELKAQTILRDYSDRFALFNRPARSWVPRLKYQAVRTIRWLPFARVTRVKRFLPVGFLIAFRPLFRALRRRQLRNLGDYLQLLKVVGQTVLPRYLGLDAKAAAQALYFARPGRRRHVMLTMDERTQLELKAKTEQLNRLVGLYFVGRGKLFRELIRLERKRGNDLLAATYSLRLMRWNGADHFGDLRFVTETLTAQGYRQEAETALAMFGNPAEARVRCAELIEAQYERHRTKPVLPLELVDDRRTAAPIKVSVIVSLYRAASKLPTFVSMLRQQTLLTDGQVEIVFVDSGSPTDEYAIFQELMAAAPLSAVYLRSANRETIQAAWNRGIHAARGEYLTFLGVDEGIHPTALTILAAELNQHPSVDWVMANSVVTNVDRKGVYDNDIMPYDRSGYRQDWSYLDSTFLSYVGGLYRRTIHDRFGYYDESFTAAGDTEFKNRILPYIETQFVPQTLGVFNNYPEARTTAHPRAEIEDLRAWYLHRTVAGMDRAMGDAPTERLISLFTDTLRYRKCYLNRWSTDLDLALSLATLLEQRPDAGPYGSMRPEVERLLTFYRSIELDQPGDQLTFIKLVRVVRLMGRLQNRHARTLGLATKPAYQIFNDNRYEQHWWPWAV